jgi:hypothetical protein
MALDITQTFSLLAGLGAGIVVTRRLHNDPTAGRWGERLGPTNLRYANLPAGGTIAIAVSSLLPEKVRAPVRALGVGATIAAVGWGFVDPLQPPG